MAAHYDFDLVVIGAGIAGMVAAVTGAGLGKRVAVVEKARVGGACTNLTCVPSKALIRLAHAQKEMDELGRLGLLENPGARIDGRKVMTRVRSIVRTAHEKDLPETFEAIGIRVMQGHATFEDPHSIRVDDRVVSSKVFVIAAGTRPLVPPIPGLDSVDYLTNENVFDLDDLPRSLLILGGGVDGLEYASAFGRLGVETTVVDRGPRLLPMADKEVVNLLRRALERDGIRILSGATVAGIRKEEDRVALSYKDRDGKPAELRAERALITLGREPDISGLGLENAGVEYTPRGIVADDKLRTAAANIYACGDVVGPYQLASTAESQGILAATNAIMPVKRKIDYSDNVYVIFTQPTLAFLGMTEEEAHGEYGDRLAAYRFSYNGMRRALIDGDETGMAKFLTDGRGRLVGAHILGEAAAEVIHEAQAIKAMRKPLYSYHNITHAYPTYAQALVGRASQLAFLDRMGSSRLVRTGLALLPGYSNRLSLARDRLAETSPDFSESAGETLGFVVESKVRRSELLLFNAVCVDGKACVLELPAEMERHDEEPILAAYAGVGVRGLKRLILNFGRVERMDGLGACMLVKLVARAKRMRLSISAFGVDVGLREILAVTELDQAIEIHANESEALRAAGVSSQAATGELDETIDRVVETRPWAKPVAKLRVPQMPREARNLNVNGRRPIGPVNGFGQLWQKTYRLTIDDPSIDCVQAMKALKKNFARFQPSFNRFYTTDAGIEPGEIVLIDSSTPGGPVSTGVMVLYADQESFTFITPEGHPECGFVTFSARKENDRTVVQVYGLTRASDPIFEAAFHMVGSKIQIRIWRHLLTALAAHLGTAPLITVESNCVDSRFQWSEAKHLRYNSQILTLLNEPRRMLSRIRGGHRSGVKRD